MAKYDRLTAIEQIVQLPYAGTLVGAKGERRLFQDSAMSAQSSAYGIAAIPDKALVVLDSGKELTFTMDNNEAVFLIKESRGSSEQELKVYPYYKQDKSLKGYHIFWQDQMFEYSLEKQDPLIIDFNVKKLSLFIKEKYLKIISLDDQSFLLDKEKTFTNKVIINEETEALLNNSPIGRFMLRKFYERIWDIIKEGQVFQLVDYRDGRNRAIILSFNPQTGAWSITRMFHGDVVEQSLTITWDRGAITIGIYKYYGDRGESFKIDVPEDPFIDIKRGSNIVLKQGVVDQLSALAADLNKNGSLGKFLQEGYMGLKIVAPDQAMFVKKESIPVSAQFNSSFTKGGIDFNANKLDLQIKRDEKGMPLPVQFQDLDKFKFDALYPVILNMSPAPDMLQLLGLNPKAAPQNPPVSQVSKLDGLYARREFVEVG